MLRTVLAGIKARLLKLLLSAIAITLGVAFVAGAFILSDAVGAGLRATVAVQTRGVDASITTRRGFDDQILAKVRRVPGVAAAEPRTTVSAPLRDPAGRAQDSAATNLPADEKLRPFDLVEGRVPGTGSEVAMARETATGYALGQPVTVFGQDGQTRTFTLVGKFDRPQDSGVGAAPLVLLPDALRQLSPENEFAEIVVRAAPGVSQTQLVSELKRAVNGRGIEVATGREAASSLLRQTAPDSAALTKFFSAFAVLAMIVAAMVITNSFTILVAQRARELALLRCVGAGKKQVFTAVLAEAVVVGSVASVAGLFGGLGVAAALQAITGTAVYVPITARTIVAALAIGVLVTTAAAAIPAWSATRVSPVEALRNPVEGKPARIGRVRVAVATVLLVAGAGSAVFALGAELETGATLSIVAMVALLGAVLTAGPLLVGPVVRLLGAVFSPLLGQPAKLAALNAERNPKRTAASAAALTIGLAVVSLVTTVAAGVEAGQNQGLDRQLTADYVVTSVISNRPLPPNLVDGLAAVPGVTAAVPRKSFSGNLGTFGLYQLAAVPGDALGTLLRPAALSGRLDRLGPGELAVSSELARETGLVVGDIVQAGPRAAPVPLRVVAIYDSVNAPGADLELGLVDATQQRAIALDDRSFDESILVKLAPGADQSLVRQALAGAPLAELNSLADLKERMSAPLRSTLDLLWTLTALAVLIAFAGIANTLSLSVLERQRESALLRALGLTRGGLGAALAAESVFVALLGAFCGLVLGVGAAWLLTRVVDEVLFTLPWGRLGILVGGAVVAAGVAALVPKLPPCTPPAT